jgi:hypothetical protein
LERELEMLRVDMEIEGTQTTISTCEDILGTGKFEVSIVNEKGEETNIYSASSDGEPNK